MGSRDPDRMASGRLEWSRRPLAAEFRDDSQGLGIDSLTGLSSMTCGRSSDYRGMVTPGEIPSQSSAKAGANRDRVEAPLVGRYAAEAARVGAEGRLSRSPCPPLRLTHDLQSPNSQEDLCFSILQGEDR
jgi:hypothetical protein